jgi:septum site-determining protein MinD
VAVTSGKGGVGKTTSAASFAMGLAAKNPSLSVCVVDFDIGLRNLDIHLGAERRVIFDFINLLQRDCTASQALIRDKKFPNLSLLAASQTKDKDSLTISGVEHVLATLAEKFDYVVLDSPAGIESGAKHAMYGREGEARRGVEGGSDAAGRTGGGWRGGGARAQPRARAASS